MYDAAIWMLPEDWVYGEWPVSGEIDIIESIGKFAYLLLMKATRHAATAHRKT